MRPVQRVLLWAMGLVLAMSASAWAKPALNIERLDDASIRRLEAILKRTETPIAKRRARGTLPLLTFQELYAPLTPAQRSFLEAIRAVRPESLQGSSRRLPAPSPKERFTKIKDQWITKEGERQPVPIQYVPEPVHAAYQRMMTAMQRDLGKHLLVESGYRSPAHQLYLFCFYLPKHGYSIRETNRFVALPGCSEHGCPSRQAIDFMDEHGVNGEDHPEQFEALDEYHWLQQHAGEYGFFLSYPRDNTTNTTFEPWHWHFELARDRSRPTR